jgi:hypothetical protein
MNFRSVYYQGTQFEKVTTGEVPEILWHLSLARGCVDWDRCNGHTQPSGSCAECLQQAQEMIDELKRKGIEISAQFGAQSAQNGRQS